MKECISKNKSQIEQRISGLAGEEIPDFNDVIRIGSDTAAQIKPGRSAFLEKYGCSSELEYKRQCMEDGRIMYHAHIGMNDMPTTARALQQIYSHLDTLGFRMDRAGFALDRRMGLPSDLHHSVAAETGPMLTSAEDWSLLAQAAPIQPHLGDFMIGQPASLANTIHALRIGCTTIGNLSQFFTFEAPGWKDRLATSAETIKAIALLGRFRERGMMLHSYLEDGYGALFKHCSTVAAWAKLEHFIVEELLGAKLSHCIGGLTSDPIKRAGWVLALQRIHRGEQVGSMIYGDTISFGPDFDKNRALTAEYLLWDILVQKHSPSGHAVLPLPVTEAIRIPSAEEILEAQCFGRQLEAAATRLYPHVDFTAAQAFADTVYEDGNRIYENALQGLKQCGVDCRNPLQMLYVLKNLGAQDFEALFAGDVNTGSSVQTDMFLLSQSVIEDYRPLFESAEMRKKMRGRQLLLASSDVHEHAIGALAQLLSEAGAKVTNLGAEQTPQDLVKQLMRQPADALLLSTHNGMALEYARELKASMESNRITLPVVLGGVLNQKVDNAPLPVPVIDDLKQLGFHPAISLPNLTELLEDKSNKDE
jgi:methylmalonyl-CoA mutase cobalamin-binding subunit